MKLFYLVAFASVLKPKEDIINMQKYCSSNMKPLSEKNEITFINKSKSLLDQRTKSKSNSELKQHAVYTCVDLYTDGFVVKKFYL